MPENGLLHVVRLGVGGCLHAWTPPHPLWSAYTCKLHNSNTVQRRGLGKPSLDLPMQQLASFRHACATQNHSSYKGGKIFVHPTQNLSSF